MLQHVQKILMENVAKWRTIPNTTTLTNPISLEISITMAFFFKIVTYDFKNIYTAGKKYEKVHSMGFNGQPRNQSTLTYAVATVRPSSFVPSGGSRISRRGRGPRRGRGGLPRWLLFENCVCRNKRIWTLRGACAGHTPL